MCLYRCIWECTRNIPLEYIQFTAFKLCFLIKNFLFQGNLVTQNMSLGVIISTHSLVLQKVTRYQGGDYTCLAVNPRGETLSQPVNLRVRCKFFHLNLPQYFLQEFLF